MADTLKPLAGTGTTRGACMAGPSMKLVGDDAALVALGNTSEGVLGLAGGLGSGAMVTQTLLVVLVLTNSAKFIVSPCVASTPRGTD
jgi:hypothetical protein